MAGLKKVSVNTELPTQSGLYSVITDNGVSVKAYYFLTEKAWYAMISKINITKLVTHWIRKKVIPHSKKYSLWLMVRLDLHQKFLLLEGTKGSIKDTSGGIKE